MFVLGKGPRTFRVAFAGIGIALVLREATSDEHEQYHREIAEAINPLGKMPEDERHRLMDQAFDDVRHKWAGTLLQEWEGVVGDDGSPLPCDDAHKAAFLDEWESRKYTIPTAQAYFSPIGTVANVLPFRGS